MRGEPIRTWVELEFSEAEASQTVFRAISPDNEPLPPGLELSAELKGSKIILSIRCERSLQSLLATLDDLLHMLALAESVARQVRKP